MHIAIRNLEVNIELRKGVPLVYFNRYTEHGAAPGSHYQTAILGLPLVHIELSVARRA